MEEKNAIYYIHDVLPEHVVYGLARFKKAQGAINRAQHKLNKLMWLEMLLQLGMIWMLGSEVKSLRKEIEQLKKEQETE